MDTYSGGKIGAMALALASITSSNIMANNNSSLFKSDYVITNVVITDTRSDIFDIKYMANVANVPAKKNYRERYRKMSDSVLYKAAYDNRSLGEIAVIED